MDNLILPNTKKARHFRHGYKTAGKYSPEYSIWMNMRSRCGNPKNNRYVNYGARGIRVCDRWDADFLNFLADMGRRPSDQHSIDRIDNDGNYEPSNCKWSTRAEQCRNRTTSRFIEFQGQVKTLAEWAAENKLTTQTLHQRLKNGWDMNRALTQPVKALVSKSGSEHKPASVFSQLPF